MDPSPATSDWNADSLPGRLAAAGAIAFAAASPISYAAAQIAVGFALVALMVGFASRRIRYRVSPLDLPLALFVFAELLSIVFSVHPARSLRCLKGDWILLFYPVLVQSLRGSKDVRRAYLALLGSSTLVALYAIWQIFFGVDLLRHRSLESIGGVYIATGLFGHHLTYGGHVLITATLAVVFASQAARRRTRAAGIAVIQVLGAIASFARTAWIGLAAGGFALIVGSRGRNRRNGLLLLAVVGLLMLAIPPVRHRLSDVLSFGDDPRVRLWQTALRIWRDHPLFGAGLGSFKTQFPIYKVPGVYMATGHPHNDLLNILVHSGLLGLAAFAFIWFRFFREMRFAWIRLPAADERRPLALAGIIVAVAFFVGGLGQCFLTDEEVGTLFWFVAAASIGDAVVEGTDAFEGVLFQHP